MTVPNLITTIRIILAPIFVIYLINGQLLNGLIVLVICGVSDGIDGLVARLFNQKSRLGTFLDPIADKIVLTSAYATLAFTGFLPPWLTVMVISRDLLISLGVVILFLYGHKLNIRPSIASKITTCLQFITVILVLSKDYLIFMVDYYIYIYYLTALFTIISFLQYEYGWFKMMGENINDA